LPRKTKNHISHQLLKIQGLVRRGQYALTSHAYGPIGDGELERKDIECSIEKGGITKVEKDELGEAKDGKK